MDRNSIFRPKASNISRFNTKSRRVVRAGAPGLIPRLAAFEPLAALPMGEGTLPRAQSVIQASLLHPHPPADADTLRCKLAKASLRGEGQDDGHSLG